MFHKGRRVTRERIPPKRQTSKIETFRPPKSSPGPLGAACSSEKSASSNEKVRSKRLRGLRKFKNGLERATSSEKSAIGASRERADLRTPRVLISVFSNGFSTDRWGVASRPIATIDGLVAGIGAAVRTVATNHYRRPRPRLLAWPRGWWRRIIIDGLVRACGGPFSMNLPVILISNCVFLFNFY